MNDNEYLIDMRPNLGTNLDNFSRQSYKPHTALAELIDNSTASFFNNEDELQRIYKNNFRLQIRVNYYEELGTNGTLEIEDNAYGMDKDDFDNALKIGQKPKKQGGRNEYGMGLKTAASWFGKTWELTSTKLNSSLEFYIKVDINHLKDSSENLTKVSVAKSETTLHGTKIKITNLNRRIGKNEFNKLISEIESLYRRDLESGKIQIIINQHICSPMKYEIFEENYDGIKVPKKKSIQGSFLFNGLNFEYKGFIGILAPGSGYDMAGFALFRNDRLVVGGIGKNYKPKEIFGKSNSPVSLRLFGEIDLDNNFKTDQTKSEFDWNINGEGLEECFLKDLLVKCNDYIVFAKKPFPGKDYDVLDKKTISKIGNKVVGSIPYELNLFGQELKKNDNSVMIKEEEGVNTFSFSYNLNKSNYNFEVIFEYKNNNELFSHKVEEVTLGEYTVKVYINLNLEIMEKLGKNIDFRIFLAELVISLTISEIIAKNLGEKSGMIHYIPSDQIRILLNRYFVEISKNFRN